MNKPTITVFTTTYNRAYILWKGYEALKRQTCKDFEWLVVDDGSTDNTRELVDGWIKEGIVPIRYIYKKNGGMHSGHNVAYANIDTELNICVDSDDHLTDNAIELILDRWKKCKAPDVAGLIGLDIYTDGTCVGTKFPDWAYRVKSMGLARLYGVTCDKKYIYRTDVIKRYMPYPEFEGEKFTPLNYVYGQIDLDYDLVCSNDEYCIVEYMQDGSTLNMFWQYRKNPRGFMHERNVYMKIYPTRKFRFTRAIHYVSCAIFAKEWRFFQKASNKSAVFFAIPFGILLNLYIRWKTRK
ncbi:MAG: glycosyltransferase family 2 protein [Bacteroidaceae bacterium]|nr:glycosyltransferase family 2 protein [Bacteroidaceae bacterium]